MSDMNCQICQFQLHGYLDNELDAGEALRVHDHLSKCAVCQDHYHQMLQLKRSIKQHAPSFTAPDFLKSRIAAQIRAQEKPSFMTSLKEHWAKTMFLPAASLAALALAVFLYNTVPGNDQWEDEAVSDHVRSLMANHLMDVTSSDRHTVKPWFIGKLDFAPPVYDFAEQGFTLIGGRMDYLQSQPVAALVYQHKKHIINLLVGPTGEPDSAQMLINKRGYNLLVWRANHMRFVAVSDMDADGLKEFGQLVQGNLKNSTSAKP